MIEMVDRRPIGPKGKKRTTRMSSKDKKRRRRSLVKKYGNECFWCHRPFTKDLPLTIDHILPLKNGGSDRLENLVPGCEPCNNGRANPPLGRRRIASDG